MDWASPFGRPVVARRAYGAWVVLLATLPHGLWSYARADRLGPDTWAPGGLMGINFRTYHHAATLARAGEAFYGVAPPGAPDWAVYLYPPPSVFAFYPVTLVDWRTGYALWTGLAVLAAVAATALLVDYVEARGAELGWVDVGVLLAALLGSTHAFGTIYYGNVNLVLALGFVVGFWALGRDRGATAGVVFGLLALVKVLPAVVGLWLLRTRRWRATAAAVATGLAGLAVGVAAFGLDLTRRYFGEVLRDRGGATQFVGGAPVDGTYYLTVQQPLSWAVWGLWPAAPYEALVGLAWLSCGLVVAWFYRGLETPVDRLMGLFVTLVVMVVAVPSFRWYVVFLYLPLVALLYGWRDGPGRPAFLAGGVLLSVPASSGDLVGLLAGAPEPVLTAWYHLAGPANAQLLGLGVMVAACAWHRHRRERPAGVAEPR